MKKGFKALTGCVVVAGILGVSHGTANAAGMCDKISNGIKKVVNQHLKGLLDQLEFSVGPKTILGFTFRASGEAPSVSAATKVKGNEVEVTLSITRGSFSASLSGRPIRSWSKSWKFPASPPSAIKFSFTCSVKNCEELFNFRVNKTKVFEWLTNKLNDLFPKGPSTFSDGGATVTVVWPQFNPPRGEGDKKVILSSKPWGISRIQYTLKTEVDVPFVGKKKIDKEILDKKFGLLPGLRASLPCFIKETPPPDRPPRCPDAGPEHCKKDPVCGVKAPLYLEFDVDKANVSERIGENAEQMRKTRELLRDVERGCKVKVIGHTDCWGVVGGHGNYLYYAIDLSERRAGAVRDWLKDIIKERSVWDRSTAEGRAWKDPLPPGYSKGARMDARCDNKGKGLKTSDDDLANNRRVEIVATDPDDAGPFSGIEVGFMDAANEGGDLAETTLYERPSKDAKKLATVRRCTQVVLQQDAVRDAAGAGKGSLWAKVLADGKTGYVLTEHVRRGDKSVCRP